VMMTEQFKRRCSNGGIAEDRVFFMVWQGQLEKPQSRQWWLVSQEE
jgi:hypothetical protein